MVRVSSPAKLRPWSELTAKMVMGVVPGLVTYQERFCLELFRAVHMAFPVLTATLNFTISRFFI